MIHAMNHFTITAENRAATLDFYCGLLGLVEGSRPDLGFRLRRLPRMLHPGPRLPEAALRRMRSR
jgi:catechol 2,3-dioxygenase-like lactoylglutathione lyase family enzyme